MAIKVEKVSVNHRTPSTNKQVKGRVSSTKRVATKRNRNVKARRTATRI